MKNIALAVLLLSSSCAWKQRDFEKDMEIPAGEAQPQIEIKDEALLEKFEVKEASDVQPTLSKQAPPVKAPAKKTPPPARAQKKRPTAVAQAKAQTVPEAARPAVKALPEDYPPEFVEINRKAKEAWDLYKPNHYVDEKVYLDIHYLGMTVGKIMATNKGKKIINGKEAWHFHARFKSAPFYSNIYELDDTVDTFVQADEFLSQKYSLIQRETKQNVDDLQLHDRDQLKTFLFYKQVKKDGSVKERNEEKYIPYYSIDPFSMLYFYQGMPLRDGDYYEIPVVNKTRVMILKSKVLGRETIKTELGKKAAIKVHASTQYTGETLKSGDLTLWFSDDERRTLLKAQAKITLGSVTADIVKR